MSSWACLRAFFDSVLEFASGLRRSTAFSRGMALPPAGPAHESATGFGLIPVTSHFRQVNSIGRLWFRRRTAMQFANSLKSEQASCNSLSAGRIFSRRNCLVSASSRWPSEASWSFADLGPRFINLTGLYLAGLYQRGELPLDLLSESCEATPVALRRMPTATIGNARRKIGMLGLSRGERVDKYYYLRT